MRRLLLLLACTTAIGATATACGDGRAPSGSERATAPIDALGVVTEAEAELPRVGTEQLRAASIASFEFEARDGLDGTVRVDLVGLVRDDQVATAWWTMTLDAEEAGDGRGRPVKELAGGDPLRPQLTETAGTPLRTLHVIKGRQGPQDLGLLVRLMPGEPTLMFATFPAPRIDAGPIDLHLSRSLPAFVDVEFEDRSGS